MEKDCDTLMKLRPQGTYAKLCWERLKNKTLTEELQNSEIARGELQSELDELKYEMKNSDKGALILKVRKNSIASTARNKKIKLLKEENSELLCIIARENLKRKENGK
jgi:hypothetical protein